MAFVWLWLGCSDDATRVSGEAPPVERSPTYARPLSAFPSAPDPEQPERRFVLGPPGSTPAVALPPLDPLVCGLGSAGSMPSADAGLPDAGGPDAGAAFDELGRPCGEGCPTDSCYASPVGGNPICTRPCQTHADCGPSGVCQAVGADPGNRRCFRRCQTDAECRSLNATAENPLYCAGTRDPADPYFGGGARLEDVCHRFCVQESEP